MITLITGVPGSGKTLYTVSEIVKKFIGTTVVEIDDDENEIVHPRTIFTNINGLRLEHELIDARDDGGLGNWHQWVQPGAQIVFDEVQKVWPIRPNGSKVPDCIQALDTHRHMGVDFVLMTQTINNMDRHLQGLVGRHLHIRRIGNLPLAIIYEWDHCSRSLMYSKAFSKRAWWYNTKDYRLYKSAKVHTKVARKSPTILWFFLVSLIGLAFAAPTAWGKFMGVFWPEEKQLVAQAAPSKPASAPAVHKPSASSSDSSSASAPVASKEPAQPALSGCIASASRCLCFTDKGVQVEPEPGFCQSSTAPPKVVLSGGSVDWYRDPLPPPDNSSTWTGTVVGTRKGWQF
ncbi:zonular occludens toxin domain-containing protein [Comamonas aquatica]|uniref:zonular occludens toxin domain-containing protein n=1 Tax=Comamonas aquatica TaxID=225991 RepID=UPI00244AE63C|nr:zonular occludens toxin domain-containing protein [Comamonas aquatica]MDH1903419.1 zonular occludens toxin domain-containing protein [Comamonas aquatica]